MTINQLINNPRASKKRKLDKRALKFNWNPLKRKLRFSNNPQKAGLCTKIFKLNPRKPNSALRSVAGVSIKGLNRIINVYIPGEGHNLREFSKVLIKGNGAKDLSGVNKYEIVRGWKGGDAEGVEGRKQGRSLYGTKRHKKVN